jgi:hypothetical protein
MTTTVGNQTGRGRLPVHSRDRRPALAALALLLIVGGGLGAGLIVYRTGQQTDVLVANHTIHPGDVVSADDLTTVRLSGGSTNTVAASNEHAYVGSVAVTTVPDGALLNPLMFHTKRGVIPAGGQSLGISVPAQQRPSTQFSAGDIVQAYYVVKGNSSGADTAPVATKIADPLLVIGVHTSSGDGSSIVSVLVGADTAAALAIPASQGNIVLTKLPVGTKPELSLTGA